MSFKKLAFASPVRLAVLGTLLLQVFLVCMFFFMDGSQPAGVVVAADAASVTGLSVRGASVQESITSDKEVHSIENANDKRADVVRGAQADSSKAQPAIAESARAQLGNIQSPIVQPATNRQANIDEKRPQVVRHRVKAGETLSSIWSKYSKNSKGAFLAAKAFKEQKVSLSRIKQGEVLELQISAKGDITGLKKELTEVKSLLLRGDSANGYTSRIIEAKVIEQETKVTLHIYSSIAQAAYQKGLPYAVIDDLVDMFGARVDFRREIQTGDSFSVIYTKRQFDDGRELQPGPIVAASIHTGGELLVAVRHVDSKGNETYFDKTGEPLGSSFLRYPLKFTRISSVFSGSRFHPVLKRYRKHNGVDFAAPTGTPVRSIGPGVVQIASWRGGGGRTVKIKHSNRYSTAYLHLSSIARGIKPGARVKRGQVIGKVGMSGLATGPHLHFSLYDYGKYVDPLKAKLPRLEANYEAIPVGYLKQRVTTLEQAHKEVKLAQLQSLHKNVG